MKILLRDAEPSGLAELLAQYLEQSLAAEPQKLELAGRLRGAVVFRAAEDADVAVRVTFDGECIELRGEPAASAAPSVRADFLSLAHLASGRAHPLWLIASGRLRVRCRPASLPLLMRVVRLLRLRAPSRAPLALGLIVAAALIVLWIALH